MLVCKKRVLFSPNESVFEYKGMQLGEVKR
ncbi:hypothetical protein KP509_28G017700 [Ceratopteris richardii]|uniref:Uncharacterized protein n=1 Tax=Ceratopteris richardii TaxID=49495 RepID=A0A8T2RCM1_CERRI|nr:hypothetical protein KP509_28G017700 [Ceratopteris richardii]